MTAALWCLLAFPVFGADYFKGETCARCHATIRDRAPGPATSEIHPAGEYDAIVIGGGMAGLTAAYFMNGRKVLLLEAESGTGGRARTESFGGRPYPVGMVYTSRHEEGTIGELFKDIGVSLKLITMPEHILFVSGRYIPEWISDAGKNLPDPPYSASDREGFGRLHAKLVEINRLGQMVIPIEKSGAEAIKEYEGVLFWDYLEKNFGTRVAELGDLYSKDVFGGGAREVSAFAGLLFMASEIEPAYTFEGGLGVVTKALRKKVKATIRTGAFAWRVRQDESGVTVEYTRDGKDYRAKARAAVLAVSGLVSGRIVEGLTPEKKKALSSVRYSSYALVPIKLKRVVWKDSFVLWNPKGFFADLTLPRPDNAPLIKDPNQEQVLVAYAPMGTLEGRRYLLKAPDEEIVSKTLADFERMFPGTSSEISGTRVIRWGHAMPLAYPGYLTQVRPAIAAPAGRLFFAGVDTQLPALEGAVYSGYFAGRDAEAFLGKN